MSPDRGSPPSPERAPTRRRVVAEGSLQYLHPGDVACGTLGDRFETLLGSCVAVILTDPRRTVGAICHIVHAGHAVNRHCDTTRHAEPALDWMFRSLRHLGIEPRLCEAYVYGGGNMFPTLTTGIHVGDRNVESVLEALAQAGVKVLVQDVGGTGYRRLGWTVGPDEPQAVTVDV